jgi:hypothetical protein
MKNPIRPGLWERARIVRFRLDFQPASSVKRKERTNSDFCTAPCLSRRAA